MKKPVVIQGDNLLESLSDPWGGKNETDETIEIHGTPVKSGAEWGINRGEVERFLKEDQLGKKFGASRVDGNDMVYFNSEEDALAWDNTHDSSLELSRTNLSGSRVDFRFIHVSSQPETVYITGDEPYNFKLYIKDMELDAQGQETNPHDVSVNLSIRSTVAGRTTITEIGTVETNKVIEVNISPYVVNGAIISFIATNRESSRSSSQYSVVRVRLSLGIQSGREDWWKAAYIQGDAGLNWGVPLTINSNVPKCKLLVRASKNGSSPINTMIEEGLSTNYTLQFTHPVDAGGDSGVYQLHLELIADGEAYADVPHSVLDFNIICVSTEDTGKYLIVNDEADVLHNYSENIVFKYAVYSKLGNHQVTIEAKVDGQDVVHPQVTPVSNNNQYIYDLGLELERNTSDNFTVSISATLDDDSVDSYSKDYTATNEVGYGATPGAVALYKGNGRSNYEADREKLVDVLTGNEITPTWTNMIWGSVNGWFTKTIKDRQGNDVPVTVLRLLEGESINIPITPLAMGATEGRTLEIMFHSRNVQDYATPVIQCWNADQGSYKGLKVTSDTISLFTTDHKNSNTQSVNYDNEDIILLTIVVNPNYNEAGSPFNACMIFINGQKQRTFVYNRDLNVSSNLIIGSEDADVDVYAIRHYNRALTVREVEQNTVNLQISNNDKAYLKNKFNIYGQRDVDFNLVKNLCNCFIFKANDGSGRIPTYGMTKNDKIPGKFRTYWKDHEDWNSEVNIDLQGQGTTSMEYFRWNFKGSLKSAWAFDGDHAPIKKICGKKNFASSMQSHKMGGTEAYDYLARICGAVADDAPRQAIWQYPFVGFAEDGLGHLTFIGLYTIGPDKGDKGTFGFTDNSVVMEGLDNEPKATNFLVPWNDDTVSPDEDHEKYYVCGQKAWEDSNKNAVGVAERWKPAYNITYLCSQFIHPWKGATIGETVYPDTEQGLLDYGQHLQDIDTSTPEGTAQYNEAILYEHWIKDTYKLYFYNPQSHQYQVSYVDGITYLNAELCDKGYKVGEEESGGQIVPILLTTTLLNNAADDDARNELFKKARVNKFRKEAGNYHDITNAIYHNGWVEDNAATDNKSKNTYPYLYNYLDSTEKFKWRQDDVDTVGPIDNQGKDKKPYCVEFDDNYSSYGLGNLSVWNGRNNQFWLLLNLAFAEEIETFMRTKYLSAKHIGSAGTAVDKVQAFYKTFYYDKAQEYFGAALYNADANYTYEQAYLTTTDYPLKSIALEQSLGDHYSAEKRWFRMRSIYMMSKYCADLFAAGNTVGTFETRLGQGANYFTVTPAIYMYPSVQNGETVVKGPRFWPGNPSLVSYQFGPIYNDGDQTVRINGMNFISDLGNLYENTLTGIININGAMLKTLKLGNHEDDTDVHSTITGLIISNAPALRNLDLGNLPTLTGTINLNSMIDLRTFYANNTGLAQITLCDGGPLATVVYGNFIRILELKNKKLLSTLTIGGTGNIEQVTMENCNTDVTNRIMIMLASIKNQLTDVSLTFGTENEPNIVTDAHIATLLELNELDITKTFGGYITKTSGSIQGDVYVALYNLGITYIGDVVPTISITSDDVEISGGTANLVSDFNAAFTGVPMPDLGDTVKYSMYANGQPVIPVGDIATYNGASLNCVTGELVTTAVSTGFAITISAYIEDSIAAPASVTLAIAKNAPITAFTIGGYENIKEAGTYQYPIASLTPSDANTPIVSLDVSFAEQDVPEGITVAANGTTGAVITVSQMPNSMTSLTLTIVATVRTSENTTTTVTATKAIIVVEEYVDLGLPSGILWAACNVGADMPTQYGKYFSWGNTFGKYASEVGSGEGQYSFSQENYALTEGYQLSGDIPIEHDAARVNLQGDARMPSGINFNELLNNCTVTWVYIGGVRGALFTSNINGKSIFTPLTGFCSDTMHYSTPMVYLGRSANATKSYSLYGDGQNIGISEHNRYFGASIRPILSPHTITINLKDENNNALANIPLDITIPGAPTEHVRTNAQGVATFRSLKATITISSPVADLDTTEIVVVGDAVVNIIATNTEFVNMGLPSGTLWAKGYLTKSGNSYIIGDPQGTGSYFSWGNIVGRDLPWLEPYDYSASNYATEGDTDAEHLDGGHSVSADISSNDAKHDAAVARLGNGWHLPTEDNFRELINECTWAFTSINNVYGFLVTGSNGNTLFFAASGYRSGDTAIGRNGGMYCWTNKWVSDSIAKLCQAMQNQNTVISNNSRYLGLTIRPVL